LLAASTKAGGMAGGTSCSGQLSLAVLLWVGKWVPAESKGKGKVIPYSIPSIGVGADPGLRAVSPQVT